jgi:hypothetical protein
MSRRGIRPVASRLLAAGVVALLAPAAPARAQAEIKVSDDVSMKFGILGQFWADWLRNPTLDDTSKNLFVRRIRLLFGGQVAKYFTFFAETDSPNLGRTLPTGKNITPAVIIQDIWGEFKPADAFMIDAGLMFVPFSRNAIQSAASLLPIDYGPFTFSQSAPTQSSTGRDTGFMARGYVAKNRLEYRIGAFMGSRDPNSFDSLRYAGRLQYEFLDTEGTGFFYTGTYLGAKKVASIAGAFDSQGDYHAYDADAFIDYPIGRGAVTAQFDYNRFDGGTRFATLPKQDVYFFEAGYYVRAIKAEPVVQYSHRDIVNTSTGDTTQWSVGGNFWWAAHNANVKAAYTRISPKNLAKQNEFTIQLQVFYF